MNILPVLQGEEQAVNPTRFWQWNRYAPEVTCNAAVRKGPWKLVRPQIPEAMRSSREEQAIDLRLGTGHEAPDPAWFSAPMPERKLSDPPRPALYHLENDPAEQHNLADREPDRVHRMMLALEYWFEEVEKERLESRPFQV